MALRSRRWSAAPYAALLLAIPIALGCGPGSHTGDVSASELQASTGSGDPPLVLDVRTPEEFAEGHVPGAVNIPQDELGRRIQELAQRRRQEVVVYCERGPRAAKAAVVLAGAGFSDVRHLAGDMAGWRSAGLPIAR
jgi:rhodanese-related sulfurtransferase